MIITKGNLLGWYEFDVTLAVQRWVTLKKKQMATKLSNHIMIEKGTVDVNNNKSQITTSVIDSKRFSIVPQGIFEIANLVVYSESSKRTKNRIKRGTDDRKRKPWKKRNKNKKKKNRDEERCRLHELQIDFQEVKSYCFQRNNSCLEIFYTTGINSIYFFLILI